MDSPPKKYDKEDAIAILRLAFLANDLETVEAINQASYGFKVAMKKMQVR